MKDLAILFLTLMLTRVYSMPAEPDQGKEIKTDLEKRSANSDEQGHVQEAKAEMLNKGDVHLSHLTKRAAPNCPNDTCPLKYIELFVATRHLAHSQSGNQHEFWIRMHGKNHYYVLPIPPGVGGHATWNLQLDAFRPTIDVTCSTKQDDLDQIFLKERGIDGWRIQAITIHYVDWCGKKTIGPDYHHFNKFLDGDSKPGDTIHYLLP